MQFSAFYIQEAHFCQLAHVDECKKHEVYP